MRAATTWECELVATLVHPVAIHAVVAVRNLVPGRPCPEELLLSNHVIKLRILLAAQLAHPAVSNLVPEGAGAIVLPRLLCVRALPPVCLASVRRRWRWRHWWKCRVKVKVPLHEACYRGSGTGLHGVEARTRTISKRRDQTIDARRDRTWLRVAARCWRRLLKQSCLHPYSVHELRALQGCATAAACQIASIKWQSRPPLNLRTRCYRWSGAEYTHRRKHATPELANTRETWMTHRKLMACLPAQIRHTHTLEHMKKNCEYTHTA